MTNLDPIELSGVHVRLEPLAMDHLDALCEIGLQDELWTWNTNPIRTRGDMQRYMQTALEARDRGIALPFATVAKDTDTVVGSTRFAAIDLQHKRMEIGWTWIAPAWQRTSINTEAKLLMLRFAFNQVGCNRVEWKTDALNERSRNAILRLGARFEGTLRSHMQAEDGRLRDTVYFSVTAPEWPEVEKGLVQKLNR